MAEYASAEPGPTAGDGDLVVAISASGENVETLAAAERYRGHATLLALTNKPGSSLAGIADLVVKLGAGEEAGGVASRSFQHTGLILLALEEHLVAGSADLAGLCRRTAQATDDLLGRRREWLRGVSQALDGPHGVFVLAPATRLSSAEQSALMFREGPRRPAVSCETGDWAHVDVYLTQTLDYRAILFAGSRYDEQAVGWLHERRSSFVSVGADLPGATVAVRYPGDDDVELALHVELLVAELLAATWWMGARG